MSYIDDSVALLQTPQFEGKVPWMYLDTRGFVTAAVGQLLATAADACQLPFQNKVGQASLDEIIADWKRVKAMAPAHSPSFYHCDSSLTLSGEAIDALLRSRVMGFDKQLDGVFPQYDSFPHEIKLALLDMIFNLGMGGLLKYSHLRASIAAKNWAAASTECYRHGPNAERNLWCENQFRIAAGLSQKSS